MDDDGWMMMDGCEWSVMMMDDDDGWMDGWMDGWNG